MPNFYEFFAGGGMVRAGLGPKWTCLFANDFDAKKSAVYRRNWKDHVLKTADVRALRAEDAPGRADLAWASFPCQDLSLAGDGAGLKGERSGAFWPFWSLMRALIAQERAPRLIALENVCGALTSHNGKDFAALCGALSDAGYAYGALVIDAALFTPQSRPRLFIIGARGEIPASLMRAEPSPLWTTPSLLSAYEKLPAKHRRNAIFWSLPAPPKRNAAFEDILEPEPQGVRWRSAEETQALLAMMSAANRAKVEAARASGRLRVGAIYKRMRADAAGRKTQRAEARFDGLAGCLRTPAGGSSRQLILVVDGDDIRSRLISARETARLMGLPEDYELPDKYNDAYHLTGDGVVVPVVRHLAEHLFEPLLLHARADAQSAA